MIADNFLQQVLLRPEEYDVIATLNLNGDYVSDALAAQVGGIGIAPGRQHRRRPGGVRGHARHRAGLCRQGSRQSRLAHPVGGDDAALPQLDAKRPISSSRASPHTIANKELTYDLARLREAIKRPKRELAARKNVEEDLQRLIPGATLMSTSGFRRRRHPAHG